MLRLHAQRTLVNAVRHVFYWAACGTESLLVPEVPRVTDAPESVRRRRHEVMIQLSGHVGNQSVGILEGGPGRVSGDDRLRLHRPLGRNRGPQ